MCIWINKNNGDGSEPNLYANEICKIAFNEGNTGGYTLVPGGYLYGVISNLDFILLAFKSIFRQLLLMSEWRLNNLALFLQRGSCKTRTIMGSEMQDMRGNEMNSMCFFLSDSFFTCRLKCVLYSNVIYVLLGMVGAVHVFGNFIYKFFIGFSVQVLHHSKFSFMVPAANSSANLRPF